MIERHPMPIAVATENSLLELGLRSAISQWPDLHLVGVAGDVRSLIEQLSMTSPHVLIVDARMMGKIFAATVPDDAFPKVLLVSERRHAAVDVIERSGRVCGLICGTFSLDRLRSKLKTLASCRHRGPVAPECLHCPARRSLKMPELPLTAREREVFVRIGVGEGNAGIAAALGLSVKTIEAHRENMKAKLGIDSAYALLEAAIAWRNGELDLSGFKRP